MDEVFSTIVCSNLYQAIDGFSVEVEDRIFVFEVELLAFNDYWSCVYEEHDCQR